MRLKRLEIFGFKSFAKKSTLEFNSAITAVVGPNGSGKSNVAESIRFVLGEQSMKSMRGKRGEDLIFNGSKSLGRMGKAGVTIVFDNKERIFPGIDFDEVAITREVSRDGTNEYMINGTQVRLRDVFELLAFARIGASGHHIISQGEADRVLSANLKDRREMIEDALGLRVYQYKRAESERKLEKTEENMKEAESLRREIAPHIRFLKKQMEKIKEAEDLRLRLTGLYREYLKREEIYVNEKKRQVLADKAAPSQELRELDGRIADIRAMLEREAENLDRSELIRLDGALTQTRGDKDQAARAISRIEGMIEVEDRRLKKLKEGADHEKTISMKFSDLSDFVGRVGKTLADFDNWSDIGALKHALGELRGSLHSFVDKFRGESAPGIREAEEEIAKYKSEKAGHEARLGEIARKMEDIENALRQVNLKLEQEKEKSRDEERQLYALMNRRGELSLQIEKLSEEERRVEKNARDLETELGEAGVLIGRAVLDYSEVVVDPSEVMAEPRERQDDRKRDIERAKIRLEDLGLQSAGDITKEFTETTERDLFLEKELLDLAQSAESLRNLIIELNEKLEIEFKEGLTKINKQFREFFALMFGGGVAELQVAKIEKRKRQVDEDGETILPEVGEDEEGSKEEGIDIHVSLPHKKIRGLQMLSGGERALTSIALLFAISQVNPPPFMVLDETDAALDEANSRKYGDMIENLARYSQLIVITHNRETMARAGVLYGVTMGADAVSKLLSIKFEEAVQVAK